MYTIQNFASKAALKRALAAGHKVGTFQPGGFFEAKTDGTGTVSLEGPHYPAPHTWYASALISEDGIVLSVK